MPRQTSSWISVESSVAMTPIFSKHFSANLSSPYSSPLVIQSRLSLQTSEEPTSFVMAAWENTSNEPKNPSFTPRQFTMYVPVE